MPHWPPPNAVAGARGAGRGQTGCNALAVPLIRRDTLQLDDRTPAEREALEAVAAHLAGNSRFACRVRAARACPRATELREQTEREPASRADLEHAADRARARQAAEQATARHRELKETVGASARTCWLG